MKAIIFLLLAAFALTACSNYGKKVKSGNIEVYYKDGVTGEQAKKAADALSKLDNENAAKKSFQLIADGDTVLCKMVVDKEKSNNVPDASFIAIGTIISENAFTGKPVNMDLTDTKFKSIRIIRYEKKEVADTDESSFGEKVTSGNVEVYVTGGASMSDGKTLAQLLDKEMNPPKLISFQLTKSDGLNAVRMVFAKEKLADLTDEEITNMAAKISDGVFDSSPLVFEFTDTQFKTLKTFTYDPE